MWQPLHRLVCWIKCLHFLSLALKVCSVELFAQSLENNKFRSVTFDPYTVCCAPPQNCYWCPTCCMEKDQELGLLSAQALFILRQERFPLVSHGRANIAHCCSLRYDTTPQISAFLRKAAMQGALCCIIAPTCCSQVLTAGAWQTTLGLSADISLRDKWQCFKNRTKQQQMASLALV